MAQEESIVKMIEKCRWSCGEAIAAVKEWAVSYTGVPSKQTPLTETALRSMENAATKKAVAKHGELLVRTMGQCLAQMQLSMANLLELLQAFSFLRFPSLSDSEGQSSYWPPDNSVCIFSSQSSIYQTF